MQLIQKSKLKSIFVLFMVAMLLIVIILAAQSNSDYSEKLISILNGCQSRGGSMSYGCFRDRLAPLVKADHLGEIASSLETIFAQADPNQYGVVSCHGSAHVLGEIAVSKGIEWKQIIKSCNRSCDYGCEHGAFSQLLREDRSFVDNLKDICAQFSDYDVSQYKYETEGCYHIVGHSLGELYPDVALALNACGEFDMVWQRNNCAEGVLMDYFFGSTLSPAVFEGEEREIITFCNSLPQEYSQVCLENLGFYAYSIIPDKEKAAKTCLAIRENLQEPCFYSLGNRAFFALSESPEEAFRYCSLTGTFINTCIKGVIEGDIAASKEAEFSLALCQLLGVKEQEECLRFLNDTKTYIWEE